MALFKINKGLNANLPEPRHDGYAYFTTDDGKFWIDFEDNVNGVTQQDGIKVNRKALNAERADYVGYKLTLLLDGETPNWGDGGNTYNGLIARSWNITPENINAIRRDGDTVPGQLTLNNVLTVNNDAYIDSATIGDLLVNGGTRFVGAVNAGTITASQFVGPLQGTASNAAQTTGSLYLKLNGQVQNGLTFNGSADKTWEISPATVGAVDLDGDTMAGNLLFSNSDIGIRRPGRDGSWWEGRDKALLAVTSMTGYNATTSTKTTSGSWEMGAYNYDTSWDNKLVFSYVPDASYTGQTNDNTIQAIQFYPDGQIEATGFIGNSSSANKVNNKLILLLDGETPNWGSGVNTYDGENERSWNITPQSINAFDVIDGSTVSGEAIFNNAVYLNDETYADSLTIGNGIVTGALRVVGALNGSTINATSFVGDLTGTASNAAKTTGALTLKINNTVLSPTFNGNADTTITISTSDILDGILYAGSSTQGGPATSANKLIDSVDAGDATHPVYFANGVPVQVSGTQAINVASADKVNNTLTLLLDGDNFTDNTYDGSNQRSWDITPELINAVRRDGDTIPGPLTINGVLTINNDAYIDSATIGDLLVNGGTKFVGDVNAGQITASNFIGDLTGNASTATAATKANRVTMAGSVVFYEDNVGTFGNTYELLWDNTNGILTAPEVKSYITVGQKTNTTLGEGATIEGYNNTGSGQYSHAEGTGTKATQRTAHAEGYNTTASGYNAHAEGFSTTADGNNAHAEGQATKASGYCSHAEGLQTTARRAAQHVFGQYNIADVAGDSSTKGTYVEIVGNGAPSTYSNARTLDWSGNEWLAGSLTATSLIGSLNNSITLLLDGETPEAQTFGSNIFNNNASLTWNITPQSINAFDIIDGSTVSGEAIFNNVVYLNDETYADSLTAENELVTGTLRVVGDLNGSTINATSFVGDLTGTASNAAKTTGALTLKINNTVLSPTFNGNADTTITINTSDILDGILYAGSSTQGGAATSAEKLVNSTDAGDATHPVYFANGVPVQVSGTQAINVASADKVNETLTILLDGELPLTWASGSNVFDGSTERSWNITPEIINAIRRDGDTIPGPLTLNGVFTVNNDAYIDSATIGDLLVNGGTRFVGTVNANTVNATSFVGDLTGTASNASQTTGSLYLNLNGQVQSGLTFNGSADKTWNINPSTVGAVDLDGDTMTGSLTFDNADIGIHRVARNGSWWQGRDKALITLTSKSGYSPILSIKSTNGSWEMGHYDASSWYDKLTFAYVPDTAHTGQVNTGVIHAINFTKDGKIEANEFLGNATSANKVNNQLTLLLDGENFTDNTYDGENARSWNITPQSINAFDIVDGSTVSGEAIFNNAVYLNDETYADSLTVGNEIITGALRVVGAINGSTVTATTFNGYLNGTAKEAEKTTGTLTLTIDGSTVLSPTFNGSQNTTINISSADVLASLQYAGSASAGGSAYHALKLVSTNNGSDVEVGSSTQPVYFDDGVPVACTGVIANASTAESLTILLDGELPSSWTAGSNVFNGATERSWNITPEAINAVRRDGDIIPGPLTLNGVFTVNNDAYIDSATIGDLLVNGGTRFIGTVNASTINATSFVGDLTGTASNAAQTTGVHTLKLNNQIQTNTFNGSQDVTWDISPATVGAVDLDGDTMTGALTVKNITIGGGTGSVAGRLIESNDTLYINRKAATSLIFQQGGTECARFDVNNNFVPKSGATATIGTQSLPWPAVYATTFHGNATSATKVNNQLTLLLDGENFTNNTYDGENARSWDITPQAINAFDIIDGSTVSGEAVFNNIVYLNDETYADSITIGKGIVTGAFRVVGNLNGSVINATTFNGYLNGHAAVADTTAGSLYLKLNGNIDSNNTFNGSADKTWDIQASTVGAVALTGDTMTGNLTFSAAPYGIRRTGGDYSYRKGRDGALVASTSLPTGKYSPTMSVKTSSGSWEISAYDNSSWTNKLMFVYVPDATYGASNNTGVVTSPTFNPDGSITATSFSGNATSASKVNNKLTLLLDSETPDVNTFGSNQFDGSAALSWNITPQSINAFDVLDGSTVSGEAIFNNVVYLNDETYADSLTAENELVTGTLRVVGDLNGSIINATTFNGDFVGDLTGTASNAAQTTGTLTITLDGETPDSTVWPDGNTFNGSADRGWDISPQNIHAFDVLDGDTVYGPAIFNNTLTVNNDAYIDSATIGDLLINGGTRFIGDVNASTINATNFVGPLTGTASNAAQTTGSLYLKLNNQIESTLTFNGSTDKTWDIQPSTVGAAPAVNGIYYGTCATAAATKAKEVILVNGTGFEIVEGAMIAVKFTNASAKATMTLKVGTDAASAAAATGHNLYRYGTTTMADGAGTTGWRAGAIVLFVFNGTGWVRTHWENTTYTLPTVTTIDCNTAAGTAAKAITNGAWLVERDGNIQEVTMHNANTYVGALTFNNKQLWINGHPSSATNYTLPAGKYMVYYNGDYYCFNTNGHYAGKDFIHSINVGSSSIGTAGVYTYYKFASFAVTGANEVASTIVRYRATYKVNSVYPAYNQNNGYTFTVDFTLNTDASNNILITSINCSYNGAMPYNNYCYYAVASDNKTLELYWASYATYHYLANIELLTVDKILLAGDTIPECVAYISGTGYELTFLYLNDVTTNSVTVGTPNMINNYAYSRYAVNSYYLYQYAAPANNTTTKYFLCGGGQSATSTTYSTINSQANYSPDVYLLNRELYAPLHVAKFYGIENVSYGSTLPSSATEGQLFFHIGGSQQQQQNSSISIESKSSGQISVLGYDGSDNTKVYYNSSVYVDCTNGVLRGAAWNDYAEYRKDNPGEKHIQTAGHCVKETGTGELELTTMRLERGCEIISDTYGMAIGQDAEHNVPIAVSGRVLAYTYENRDEYKSHIGWPVCSGPNGTVSIMTEAEEEKYPSRIIGTISEVPEYEVWGKGNIQVDGRVWIRIR